ncbi:hypothetical protein IQ230_19005 [Gloeocapsopsis crepidinum LEGE 06123]|uniref:Uncharacterized protein n=1 Tax=Gloeocapsopsis crepidinum LEGE 06123 TaxID=588587 RepID=A0ABR9UVT7_9CHRO|nr:hypothetical protein [Gloeocapsopsis crepidinum]MBE9192396.1 hypothetical protein [Gloeocapsopsis crepidinum LEGE 06123]
MTFDRISETIELFTKLSDTEQETVVGGLNADGLFFFQITAIDSFTSNQTGISGIGDDLSVSSSSNTGYSFRQITLAFTSSLLSTDSQSPLLLMFSLFN